MSKTGRDPSNFDNNMISRLEHDDDTDAKRVIIVGGIVPDFKFPDNFTINQPQQSQEIRIVEVEKPIIIKEQELQIVEVEKQVIVYQDKIQIVEKIVNIPTIEYKEIEKPIFIDRIQVVEVEKPIIIEKTIEKLAGWVYPVIISQAASLIIMSAILIIKLRS